MADSSNKGGQYIVVARRYRPQGFDDLVGQGMVSQALKNAIQTDRVGHAYLFTGARGVGKTSTARILSKALNCERGPTESPCHECDICQTIAAGEDVDVLEIDGASNRGIDEIRQLRSNVSVRPSRSRYKIYIIDEVHMLTKEAFNALLKTLEEPPEHVKFIFCTTDPEKIPITVLSRCQRFDFSPVGAEEIVTRLQHIVESEGAEADEEALRLLARKAAGSVRDSQSLLEQLLSFTSDRITVEAVHSMLGTAGTSRLYGVIRALAAHDAAEALRELDRAVGEGVDAGQLTEQLLGCLRDLMALSVGGGKELLMHSSESDADQLAELAKGWGTQNLLAAAQIVDQALARMRLVTHSRVLLETALIRIAKLEDLQELSGLIRQLHSSGGPIESKKKTETVGGDGDRDPSAETVTRLDAGEQRPSVSVGQARESVSGIENVAMASNEAIAESSGRRGEAGIEAKEPDLEAGDNSIQPVPPSNGSLDAEAIWRQATAEFDGIVADCASHSVHAANPAPNRLVITFPSTYNSSKSFCERPEKQGEMEKIVSRIAGRKMKLEFAVRADAAHDIPARPVMSVRQREREITQRPFVQRAVELFSANISSVSSPKQND